MARVPTYASPGRGHLFPIVPVLDELRVRCHEIALLTPAARWYRATGGAAAAADADACEQQLRQARSRDHSPNQRARLTAPNSCFSAAYSRDGSLRCAAAAGPLRKSISTLLTSPSPNSA